MEKEELVGCHLLQERVPPAVRRPLLALAASNTGTALAASAQQKTYKQQ
jgi:hypothetical protein